MKNLNLISKKRSLVLGILMGLFLPLSTAELYLRWFPIKDIQPFLGDASPLEGVYKFHNKFGITYKAWEEMCQENLLTQEKFLSLLTDTRPLWMFCGSSFAYGLVKASRKVLHDRRIADINWYSAQIPLLMAQVEMLLKRGLRPQRIFFCILPQPEGVHLVEHPLKTRYISSKGAMLYHPHRAPWGIDWFVRNLRIGLAGWVRSGRATETQGFRKWQQLLYYHVNEQLLGDLRTLFSNLAEVTHPYGVKVTIILIPHLKQILKGAGFAFQDALKPMFESIDYEVIDPREEMFAVKNRWKLYDQSMHLTELGNRKIIDRILKLESCETTYPDLK